MDHISPGGELAVPNRVRIWKVYEGEVTELTPEETENPLGGYGRTVSHVVIGLKTIRGGKQLRYTPSRSIILEGVCFVRLIFRLRRG